MSQNVGSVYLRENSDLKTRETSRVSEEQKLLLIYIIIIITSRVYSKPIKKSIYMGMSVTRLSF